VSDLDNELAHYRTLAFLTQRAMERALSNPSDEYVRELGFPPPGKRTAERKEIIKEYFDSVKESLFDQYLLRLVSAFERLAFKKLKNALGIARKTLEDKYPRQSPFSRAARDFVKDTDVGFNSLAEGEELLKSYPRSTPKNLQELRLHRNCVAHGGRLGERSTFSKIEDVHKALADLLSVIETKEG
jgi:hypothetical protein